MSGARLLKRALMFSVAFTLCVLGVSSQAVITFERTYGAAEDDRAYSVQQTADEGYIVAGQGSSSPGLIDLYLVKTDSLGNPLWTGLYQPSAYNAGYSVQQTLDEGYIVVTGGFGLIKTDPYGNLIWTNTYGTELDFAYSVEQTLDGGYIVAGEATPPGQGYSDVYLVKANPVGEAAWTRFYGGPGTQAGRCVAQTTDGGYVIAGYTLYTGGMYVVKTDSTGNAEWIESYPGPVGGRSIEQTTEGGYIICGSWDSDVFLAKLDSAGALVWSRKYGGPSNDRGRSASQTTDGGYIAVGTLFSHGPGRDVYLVKTDSNGNSVWTRTYGGLGDEYGHSVHQTSDGGYIIAGQTSSFGAGGTDMYLIKTDSLGRVQTCEPVEPWEVRTQGYWRRQCKHNPHEDICAYVDNILVLADLFDTFNCDSVCDLMNVKPPENDMCRKARRQFMALLLNVTSGKLAVCNCLEDGREVGDVVTEIDSLLSADPDFHTCEYAKTLTDDINNGIGLVPCDSFLAPAHPASVSGVHSSAFPNPFGASTTIRYELSVPQSVRLAIYNSQGRLVRVLVDGIRMPGLYRTDWDGLDRSGDKVPMGVYFARLQVGDTVGTKKLVFLR